MRKYNKKQIIFDKIGENLNFCDKIIMKILKKYTIKVYRIGLNDAFNWENQKYKKNNLQGCTVIKITKMNFKIKILKANGE